MHYFTMVENRWKSVDWPPPATTSYFTCPQTDAAPDAPRDSGCRRIRGGSGRLNGERSRWRSQVASVDTFAAPDRKAQDAKLLTYTPHRSTIPWR